MTGQVYIRDMKFHAYHGVLEQERTVGNDYVVNVTVGYPLEAACKNDNVSDTLNYAELSALIQEEMAVPSNLIEHVAYRIAQAILARFPLATDVSLDIRKVTPPMKVDASGAGVKITVHHKP